MEIFKTNKDLLQEVDRSDFELCLLTLKEGSLHVLKESTLEEFA